MQAPSTEKSSLRVDRFHAQYLIAPDHSAPESVKRRLDATLRKTLPDALRFALSGWLSDSDSSIWFVRELRIDLDLNIDWDSEQVARTWAVKLARQLSRDLSDGDDSHGVVRFPNRAAYLASFLADLANGSAWGKWYYKTFDGLRMLPSSAALRTAICQEPENGSQALLQLATTDLANVLSALSTQDVRRVLEGIAQNEPPADESHCFEELWKAWLHIEPEHRPTADEARTALRLYLEAHRFEGVSGPTLRTAALALVRLALRCETGSESKNQGLMNALINGNVAALYSGTDIGDAELLSPFILCSRALVEQIWNDLARSTARVPGPSEPAQRLVHTRFGGIFLLLPMLDKLPLESWTENWPDPLDGQSAAALMRFLILVKCCGQERSSRAFYDPLLRDLLRIDPAVTHLIVAEWQARIHPKNLDGFLSDLASWQRENGAQRGERLALVRARYRRGAIGLLLDIERGCWLSGKRYRTGRSDISVKQLLEWWSRIDGAQKVVFTDSPFAESLCQVWPTVEIIRFDAAHDGSNNDEAIKAALLYLDKVNDDLKYLSLPDEFHLSTAFDLTCSIAAQGLMRNLAWRLPGFSRSGLPYLYRNFLDFPGNIEAEPERYVVRLGRPPLNIILAVTGLLRATYRLRWTDDEKPFQLFQGE